MGTTVTLYFLHWLQDDAWIDTHISNLVNIGGTLLGTLESHPFGDAANFLRIRCTQGDVCSAVGRDERYGRYAGSALSVGRAVILEERASAAI